MFVQINNSIPPLQEVSSFCLSLLLKNKLPQKFTAAVYYNDWLVLKWDFALLDKHDIQYYFYFTMSVNIM